MLNYNIVRNQVFKEIVMKKIVFNIFRILFLAACLLAAVFCVRYAFFKDKIDVTYKSSTLPESSVSLDNPYCGFYSLSGYTLSQEGTSEDAAAWGQQQCSATSSELMLIEINLKNYSTGGLSDHALQQLDQILTQCELAKKQVILRCLYDWDGKAKQTEPSSLSIIQQHMQQMASTINKHKKCVYIMQGTFTGNNGEMNNSKFMSEKNIQTLVKQLSDVIDPDIFLAVRTPAQLRMALQNKSPLTITEAFSGTTASRLSLFNDGMLGSVYDLGTYDDTPFEDPLNFTEQGTRNEELTFQNQLCQYVPNGGEVTVDNEYNDLDNAISDLETMHVSYLNCAHDKKVLDKWKSSTYTGSGVFFGDTGYDYIEKHLGYRYVFERSKLDFDESIADSATLYITISNVGFAPAYKQFTTSVYIKSKETNDYITAVGNVDNRQIGGNTSSSLKVTFNIRSLDEGKYDVMLSMKDPSTGKAIHFANIDYENSSSIPIGSFSIYK